MRGGFDDQSIPQGRVGLLFLLRTYNDIDHIVPIIWKAASLGYRPLILFVDREYHDDYRVRFAVTAGAAVVACPTVRCYHREFRRWFQPRSLRRAVDRLVAHYVGRRFLLRHQVTTVASEWSGAYGREMAEYFLRPAQSLGLRCVSLPHGYFIWTNDIVNSFEAKLWRERQQKPDFSDRNIFSHYVVQNSEAESFKVKRGILPARIEVLGSARFCPVWQAINIEGLDRGSPVPPTAQALCVLFFVPDWTYNVDRRACTNLLVQLASVDGIQLLIKANTRGTGALDGSERGHLEDRENVCFASMSEHSPLLIRQAGAVINFASSIGLEALLQGKPVCNPRYLNGNSTIFDDSGVVEDAADDAEVLQFIDSVKNGTIRARDEARWLLFHRRYVLGGRDDPDVLGDYLQLLMFGSNTKASAGEGLNH